MNLKQYVNEIFDIAMANNMTWDVGADMFLANIRNAGREDDQYFYHGADEVDYKALKVEWDKLSAQEKVDAKNEFNAWYSSRK